MAHGTLLLVDDDALLRMLLHRRLVALGWTVVATASAGEALEAMARHPFSLVLSDVNMPGMSGLDLCAAVRRREGGPPVVLMSGLADAAMHRAAEEHGAVGLLRKPLDEPALAGLAAAVRSAGGVEAG